MAAGDPSDITPKELFNKEVKDLRVYAKNPKRGITRPIKKVINKDCRPLSDEQIAEREQELMRAGANINPKFSRRLMMTKRDEKEARLKRLYEVVKTCNDQEGYFTTAMLKENGSFRKYISPDSAFWTRRAVYTDLGLLVDRGKIYSKGRLPKFYYLGKGLEERTEGVKLPPGEIKRGLPEIPIPSIPTHIVVDVNVNIRFGK